MSCQLFEIDIKLGIQEEEPNSSCKKNDWY